MPISLLARRRIARALIAALILSATTAVAVYLVRQRLISVVQPEGGLKTGGAALIVERIQQTSTRNGRAEWSLEAASAQVMLPEKKNDS